MFTKYNGLEIPKNYSGNRFKALSETEMKTHKVSHTEILQGATKSSVSPKFQEVIDQTINNIADVEDIEIDLEQENEKNYSPQQEDKAVHTVTDEMSSPDFSLTTLLEKIRKDDLLLIALIILFASDSAMSNYDTVIILALLLLYH